MKKSPLYTRTGDLGTTSLVDGTRVSKSHPRLEAYGTVDELNSWMGVLATDPQMPADCLPLIFRIQNRLFDLGAYLATPGTPDGPMPQAASLNREAISEVEREIDRLDEAVPPLRRFVLPGGTRLSGWCHVARTVCRRAERHCISLAASEYVDPNAIRYVNRLSDYLFVLSRYVNVSAGVSERCWEQ